MFLNMILVGCGGAIGAMLRYSISLLPAHGDFPILTLITNLLGAIAIGFIVGLSAKKGIGPNTTLFLKTGVCGGFTTFSTFSLETVNLFQGGHLGLGILYAALSLVLCLLGVLLGQLLAK